MKWEPSPVALLPDEVDDHLLLSIGRTAVRGGLEGNHIGDERSAGIDEGYIPGPRPRIPRSDGELVEARIMISPFARLEKAPVGSPTVNQELAWLKDSSQESSTDLHQTMLAVLDLARRLCYSRSQSQMFN
jgi:hypothetical protein